MESPYFPIALQKLPSSIAITELKDMEFDIGKVKVRAAFANHPGICVGYRLESSEGPWLTFRTMSRSIAGIRYARKHLQSARPKVGAPNSRLPKIKS